MKKTLQRLTVVCMAVVLTLGLAACGAKGGDSKKEGSKIDMSKYPSKIEEWSGQNVNDYFKEAGVFYDGNGGEIWLQDHATYWSGMPVKECAGWWTEDGSMAMIFVLSGSEADTSEEQLNEWIEAIKADKKLPLEGEMTIAIDHLVGNLAFSYSTVLDEDAYNAMDAAYKNLVEALGAKEEF